MTFSFKIKVDRYVGSCNDLMNPYSKLCISDVIRNISVKVFDLISQQNELRQVSFNESCKCNCLLNETVCNDKQRWNKDNCRYECLKIEKCDITSFWNFVNCKYEYKKAAKLIVKEEDEEMVGNELNNKTVSILKKVINCKPFVLSYLC